MPNHCNKWVGFILRCNLQMNPRIWIMLLTTFYIRLMQTIPTVGLGIYWADAMCCFKLITKHMTHTSELCIVTKRILFYGVQSVLCILACLSTKMLLMHILVLFISTLACQKYGIILVLHTKTVIKYRMLLKRTS